jgi:hypothetical protein
MSELIQYSWGRDGRCERVGHGKQTSSKCGQTLGFKGCLQPELHDHTSFDSNGLPVNHHGNAYIKRMVHSCDKPECPVCFKRGFAVREAGKVEQRLLAAQKKFGVCDHIIQSVPQSDYGLSYEKLKAKALENLRKLGVIGGVLIFHMERFHNRREALEKNAPQGWYVSLHFHILGVIDKGYNCRSCNKSRSECLWCCEFDGRARRMYYEKDGSGAGCITKVKEKRKTVFGTAYYQLNHATLIRGKKRSHVVTWFGVCSYKQLHLEKSDRIKRNVCPICQSELVEVFCVGENEFKNAFWLTELEEPYLDKDGMPKWIIKPQCLEA